MAREAVGNDERLHIELVKNLSFTNVQESLYFAKLLNVPESEWPWSVQQLDKENPNGKFWKIFLITLKYNNRE